VPAALSIVITRNLEKQCMIESVGTLKMGDGWADDILTSQKPVSYSRAVGSARALPAKPKTKKKVTDMKQTKRNF
jgi:hypothetical protein